MKKSFNIFLAALAVMTVSCVKENAPQTDESLVPVEEFELQAVAPADVAKNPLGTRTVMVPENDAYAVNWTETDAISVNGTASTAIKVADDNAKNATFTVSGVKAPFCTVYPAAVASDFTQEAAVITLPAKQKYVVGSFDPAASVMLGYMADEEGSLAFSHAMSYLYLTINTVSDYDTDNIRYVNVKSLGEEPMSGAFEAAFGAECTMAPADGTASTEVTLDCGEAGVAKGTPVVIAIPAGTYASGLVITITDVNDDVTTQTAATELVFKPGFVYTANLRVAAPGIYNVAGYNAFAKAVNAGDYSAWKDNEGVVNLYADITSDENYTYISNFDGTFDGNGHTITCTKKTRPLFNNLAKTAVVKNLTTAGTYTGFENQGEQAFASFARVNLGTIQDCVNETNGELATTSSIAFGGFVGQNGGTISNCENKGDILLTIKAAGLVCYGGGFAAYGHTSDKSAAGKFVDCTNNGDVKVTVVKEGSTECTITRTGFGGICGVVICDGVVFDGCTNNGTVARMDNGAGNNTCASAVGGILGRSAIHNSSYLYWLDMDGNTGSYNTKFTDCTNAGEVINSVRNGHNFKSQDSDEKGNKKVGTGGIVGALVSKSTDPAVFTRCKNAGSVKAGYNANNNSHIAGGLAGMVRNATFTDCESTGTISVYGDGNICGPMGGFVGFALTGVTISGGTAKPSITLKTVSSPSLYSYGLLVGTARATFSASNVNAGGSIKVNGTEKVTSANYNDYLCFNKHFSVTPTFTNCNWAE
ncbi:MAG: hypothetical protein II194_08075 [Bacteroidales bacterium]|nr:hypothetical protein [Bacteroidales bacterium]